MSKRTWAIAMAGAMLASILSAGAAVAQDPAPTPPPIPETPNIEDIAQDSNGLNDQGTGAGVGGDQTGTPYFGGADFLKIWFTNTSTEFKVHILTTGNPVGGNYAYLYRVWVNDSCTSYEAFFDGASDPTEVARAQIRDWCGDLGNVEGQLEVAPVEDGTFVSTLTFPMDSQPTHAVGSTLVGPFADSRMVNPALLVPVLDTTAVGTDYVVGDGSNQGGDDGGDDGGNGDGGDGGDGGDDDGTVDEPKKDKKDCKKAKKKCKKKNKGNNGGGKGGEEPKGDSCAAYVPGEEGAEAETFVVKDEHTAEAPLEITIEQAMGGAGDLGLGVYDGAAHTFRNLQVDSKAADAGLYIRYEFPVYEDHDLYVNYADGSEAAHVGGFNMTPVSIFDGTGDGGHSEQGAEQIDGLRTADCAGYTIDFSNYLGEGGEYTVKVWLGEVQNEPAAPGGGR